MNNICRPFVLHNDFLPPIPEVHEKWEFLSFGYNDGISVGNNLFQDNCDTCDFQAMWEYQVQHEEKVGNGCSSHILWGVRCEDEQNVKMKDADFWKEELDYPFLFVSLFQLSGKIENVKRMELETRLCEKGLRAITYLTLDSSDFILILKCKNYADGADIISEFHDKNNDLLFNCQLGGLTYSFTIASINRKILENDDLIHAVGDTIQRAYIYIIEKNPGSVSEIYQKIKELLEDKPTKNCVDPKENVLGCNDEVIVINNVPWNKFLKFFKYYTIMPHEWFENIIGITTIIGYRSKKEMCQSECGENKPQGSNSSSMIGSSDKEKELLSDIMREKCAKIKLGTSGNSVRLEAIKTNVYQTINSLRKFEKTPVKDYLFQIAFLPLNMVLDIGQNIEELYQEDFINSFYDFMKGLNLYAQSSDRSDRQFVQSLDLKIRIYDAPVKLNAFYNAFVFFTVKFLNDLDSMLEQDNRKNKNRNSVRQKAGKHEYEFLACPGVTNNMRVQEMFKSLSETKRLFLIEMPERQVYDPKNMLIMLVHEVGHFVGTNVRGRKERFDSAIHILGKMTVKYVQIELSKYLSRKEFVCIDRKYWKSTEAVISDKLKIFNTYYEEYLLEHKFKNESEEKKECFRKMLDKRRYHSEMLKQSLADGISHILLEEDNGLWDYIEEKVFMYWIENGDGHAEQKKSDLRKNLQKIVGDFLIYERWSSHSISAFTVIDLLVYLFKECIADMIAILTLGISLKDYLEATLRSAEAQGYCRTKKITILDIRRCLVVHCMIREKVWGDSEAANVVKNGDKSLQNVWKDTYNLIYDYLGKGNISIHDGETDRYNAVNIILDKDILHGMRDYLLESKKKFVRYENVVSLKHQRKALEEEFKLFENGNIVSVVEEMQTYIEQYLEEMEKRKNEERKKWKQRKTQ